MTRFTYRFCLFFLFLISALHAHSQLLLVTAKDMNRTEGLLQRYERSPDRWHPVGGTVVVNLGRNGMGWGLGTLPLDHHPNDPVKYEGDGRAPAGVFRLGPAFGSAKAIHTVMPYIKTDSQLVCVDDVHAETYNQIVTLGASPLPNSFEWMLREDGLYRLGIVVEHNLQAVPGRGSCIFLHIWRTEGSGTSGCTAMAANDIDMLLGWLDPEAKPLLVQIPVKYLPEIQQFFPGVGE